MTAVLVEPLTVKDIRDDRQALADLETRLRAAEIERSRACSCRHCQRRMAELLGDARPTPEGWRG